MFDHVTDVGNVVLSRVYGLLIGINQARNPHDQLANHYDHLILGLSLPWSEELVEPLYQQHIPTLHSVAYTHMCVKTTYIYIGLL